MKIIIATHSPSSSVGRHVADHISFCVVVRMNCVYTFVTTRIKISSFNIWTILSWKKAYFKSYFCTATYYVISYSFTSKKKPFTYLIICNKMNCMVLGKKLQASKLFRLKKIYVDSRWVNVGHDPIKYIEVIYIFAILVNKWCVQARILKFFKRGR